MADTPSLHVTFPVLNEELELRESIERTLAYCLDRGISVQEICIANNGSTDKTADIGLALRAQYPSVTYLDVGRRGFGLALKTAWSQTKADYVGYMDLDLATDLKHLKEVRDLIDAGAEYDVYVGSRLKRGAIVTNRTLLRGFTSRVFNRLLRFRLGVAISDAMCGFKFLRRQLYTTLADRYEFTDDWFFVTQLVVRAEWEHARVLELPVHWNDSPDSRSSARLLNLSKLYLQGIEELRRERAPSAAGNR
jgi:glycosyltransferase involved in cell wall biosynthesis